MQQTTDLESSGFQAWILKLIESLGVTPDQQTEPAGFQFETEGRIARVLPHEDPSLAITEVEVLSLLSTDSLQMARVATELMRLNHDARFLHSWQAAFDDDDTLVIWCALRTAEVDLESMADILSDGVERAALLESAVNSILATYDAPSEVPQPQVQGQIRG
jgi:hypothetical protein